MRIIAGTLFFLVVINCFPVSALDSVKNKAPLFAPLPSEIDSILEYQERKAWQQPDRVLETMGVKQGDSIADVGAGSGYFTFSLADKVGTSGKIYAADIQEGMLEYIHKKAETNKVDNIRLVKSSETDANLPTSCCNIILLVNTYHQLDDPVNYMRNLRKSLKPGGKIEVIDYKEIIVVRDNVKYNSSVGLAARVVEEMNEAGYTLSASHDFLVQQFFLEFSDKESETR